jgi:diaminopimelate decarboxylase
MPVRDFKDSRQRVLHVLDLKKTESNGDLSEVAKSILTKKKKLLDLAQKYPTPFYVLDVPELEESIRTFQDAFKTHFSDCRIFYAVKSNHHPFILETVVAHGFGLDVSSGKELKMALATKAKYIVFSGPGKTDAELELALQHSSRVTIHMDSFSELHRLDHLTQQKKKKIRAGVRIFTSVHGEWSKFGIPIQELKRFWSAAQKCPNVDLQGIQFHLSWNRTPDNYVKVIEQLGETLQKQFTSEMRKQVHFIDLGGGYFPDRIEAYYPWVAHYTGSAPLGQIVKAANDYFGEKSHFLDPYYVIESQPLSVFAKAIGAAVTTFLRPWVDADYYTEPGRIICAKAMHIMVRVVDKKSPKYVITDGGVNIMGWEYGESFYYPLVNLTHPSERKEIDCTMYGPLCTPHDLWGYSCYAQKIVEDDVIIIPNQGAYRYGLAQSFIKEIPEVRFLR